MAPEDPAIRASPSLSSSATDSITALSTLSQSPGESKASSATRPTSVSSHESATVSTMPDKHQDIRGAKNPPSRPSNATKTRRPVGRPPKANSARQASSSSTAPLLGRDSHTAPSGVIPRSSILNYLQPVSQPSSKRQLSGETLVQAEEAEPQVSPKKRKLEIEAIAIDSPKKRLLEAGVKALDMGWNVEKLAIPIQAVTEAAKEGDKRRSTRVTSVAEVVAATASTLGKKGREALGVGKDKLQSLSRGNSLRKRKSGEPSTNAAGVPPSKRTKLMATSEATVFTATEERLVRLPQMSKKTWLKKGLYVGQERGFDVRVTEAKNKNKTGVEDSACAELKEAKVKENKTLPLPMYGGEYLLKRGRDFKLPFDVFSPLPSGQPRPDEWWKKQSNRFIGEAATEWKKTKPLPPSRCLCSPEDGCAEDCQNRYMLYECDETNCAIGPEHCTNRAFAQLKERSKSGKKYSIGVEVMKTAEKGFGVRSCRTFEPNQVIVEYTGEIITQDECERRMTEEYKNNECYYLMTFDQNMIIDATRGSIARFVNHSCEPNCRMIKWTVAGKPRMALFAGDHGIMTGEELTYDYNFDPFSQKNVQACRCGAVRCRGVLGPRLSKDKEAKLVKENEAKLKEKLSQKGSAVVSGAKRKLKEVLGKSGTRDKKGEPVKKKPRGSGIWGGNWEWA